MFGTINVQTELKKLAKEEQSLRNKYGRRFISLYNVATSDISNNNRIIDQASKANSSLTKTTEEVKRALKTIGKEV